MAEAKLKGGKGMKFLMGKFSKHSYDNEEGQDGTVKWFLDNGFAGLSTQYNQLADNVFTEQMDLLLCICDAAGATKQYSSKCTYLTEFNAGWVGFYPSTYNITVPIDEEGNTKEETIVDLDQLKGAINLRPGQNFYFCGVKYKVAKVDSGGSLENGYQLMAESKETSAEKKDVAIWVRKTKNAYFIVNFAKDTRSDRHSFGSPKAVMNYFIKYFKNTFLYEDDPITPFFEENEDVDL